MLPRRSLTNDQKKSDETTNHIETNGAEKYADTSIEPSKSQTFTSELYFKEGDFAYDDIFSQEEDESSLTLSREKQINSFLSTVNKLTPSVALGKVPQLTSHELDQLFKVLQDLRELGENSAYETISPLTKYSLMLVSSLLMTIEANPSADSRRLNNEWNRFIFIHLKLMGISMKEFEAMSDRDWREVVEMSQPFFRKFQNIPGLSMNPSYLMSGIRAVYKFASSIGSILKSAFQGKRNEETRATDARLSENENVDLMRGAAMGMLVRHFKRNGFLKFENFEGQVWNIVNSCSRDTKNLILKLT